MSERLLKIFVFLLATLLAGLIFFWHPEMPEPVLPQLPSAPGGDFTLQSATGDVSLQDYRGKLVLLYFGYTYCPDICPTSLSATAAALKLLTPAEAAGVAVLFVSVDPERDSPVRLKEYVEFFDPSMRGLTGTTENLAEIARRYGVFYARQKPATTGGPYVVDHTADTYVVGATGQLLGRIGHATPPEQIAADIRKYLKQP